MDYTIHHFGDNAILLDVGTEISIETHRKVTVITECLESQDFDWMIEYISAYTSITIFYDPLKLVKNALHDKSPFEVAVKQLSTLISMLEETSLPEQRIVEIPVCYGGEYGPDLEEVAKITNCSLEEVINIHSSAEYLVYMIGFAPGFPYIGGMSEKIAAPRKATPRLKIPAGSVGIAGKQTGVYPLETPGGWQLIGRTPLRLFQPEQDSPSLLKAGDKIIFKPITSKEFLQWKEVNE